MIRCSKRVMGAQGANKESFVEPAILIIQERVVTVGQRLGSGHAHCMANLLRENHHLSQVPVTDAPFWTITFYVRRALEYEHLRSLIG